MSRDYGIAHATRPAFVLPHLPALQRPHGHFLKNTRDFEKKLQVFVVAGPAPAGENARLLESADPGMTARRRAMRQLCRCACPRDAAAPGAVAEPDQSALSHASRNHKETPAEQRPAGGGNA
jgi:hypothetical protein